MPAQDGGAAAQAQVLADAGRPRDALRIITGYIAENPDDVRAWCIAAQCHLGLQEFPSALTAAERALAIGFENEWPHRLASMALMYQHEHHAAVREADEAVRIEPFEWRTYVQRAEADSECDYVDTRTWAAARTAVELAPHEPAAHVTLGRVALTARKDRQAMRHFRAALQLDPNSTTAQNNLAITALRRRRLLSAGRLLSGALAQRPDSALYARNLQTVLVSWALVINLLATLSCLIALGATADNEVEVPATAISMAPQTFDFGSGAAITQPGFTTSFGSTTRAEPVLGHPGALSIAAAVLVVLLVLIVAAIRRSVGRSAGAIVSRVLREHRLLLGVVACSLVEVALLVIAAIAGMPIARRLVLATLALVLVAFVLVRMFRKRYVAALRR